MSRHGVTQQRYSRLATLNRMAIAFDVHMHASAPTWNALSPKRTHAFTGFGGGSVVRG